MVDIKAKFLGSMVGSALGDAIGELAFRYRNSKDLCLLLDRKDKLIYTDDTAMSIGIAESIIKKSRLDCQDLGEQFRLNYMKEPWRGYGPGPPLVFSMVEKRGMTYSEAAESLFRGQGSFGNGAAMRAAPVGLFFNDSPDLYEQACTSAKVTHTHPLGKDGAAIQSRAISLAVALDPKETFPREEFVKKLIEFAKTTEMKDKMQNVKQLIAHGTSPSAAAIKLGRSVAVYESLPFAIYSFLRHHHSFEDCLFCAIMHGGDRDTLGAMACAVSGAYVGIESIPQSWREKLENGPFIEDLAAKLFEIRSISPLTEMPE